MPKEERYQVTWALDEVDLEKQLNRQHWMNPDWRVVTIIWRPAHSVKHPDYPQPIDRQPGFITVWERKQICPR